jgi:hypothetical protein
MKTFKMIAMLMAAFVMTAWAAKVTNPTIAQLSYEYEAGTSRNPVSTGTGYSLETKNGEGDVVDCSDECEDIDTYTTVATLDDGINNEWTDMTDVEDDGTLKFVWKIVPPKQSGAAIASFTEAGNLTKTATSITVKTAPTLEPATTGQTVEYVIGDNSTAPTVGWKTGASVAFTDLDANTTYYVFARSAADEDYNAGEASSVEVKTKQTGFAFSNAGEYQPYRVISYSSTATAISLRKRATSGSYTAPTQSFEYNKANPNTNGICPTAPGSGWISETGTPSKAEFTGLTANTRYCIYARAKADDNYDIGTVGELNAWTQHTATTCAAANQFWSTKTEECYYAELERTEGECWFDDKYWDYNQRKCFADENAAKTACSSPQIWDNINGICYANAAHKTCVESDKFWDLDEKSCHARQGFYWGIDIGSLGNGNWKADTLTKFAGTAITTNLATYTLDPAGQLECGTSTDKTKLPATWGSCASVALVAGTTHYMYARTKTDGNYSKPVIYTAEYEWYALVVKTTGTPPAPPSGGSSGGCETSCSGYKPTPILSQIETGNKALHIAGGLSLSVSSSATVSIYSLNGNLVQSLSYASGEHTMSLNSLPKGMYVAKVSFRSKENTLSHSETIKITVK